MSEKNVALSNMKRYMRATDAVLSNCNYVPLRKNTSEEHWKNEWAIAQAIAFMAYQLSTEGLTVLVDPMFKEPSHPRPDIWLPSLYVEEGAAGTGVEVWKTETMAVFLKKMERYVRCGIFIRVGYVTVKEIEELGPEKAIRLVLQRAKMPKAWLKEGDVVV